MKPINKSEYEYSLFAVPLTKICKENHPLVLLSKKINWKSFDTVFGELYCQDNGRPAKATRLMVGLHYLKAMYAESDEELIEKWIENPYWQYFCGEIEFQHEFPIDPTTMGKWRKRIESKGFEELLSSSIQTGLDAGVLKRNQIEKVNMDTTVLEKAITYPTDSKLYHRMRDKLVKEAKLINIELRQTYTRKSKKALIMQGRYAHARQMKRAQKAQKQVKVYFGRVLRDLERKAESITKSEKLKELIKLSHRLINQKREDKNKIYSLHAPEVECIGKGKMHKKYEFGCKMSVVTSSEANFILGAQALHGNPYDGHTLRGAVDQVKKLLKNTRAEIKEIYVDQGYKAAKYEGIEVHRPKHGIKKEKPNLMKWIKRRSAIEPIIGHMKNDGGARKNQLHGVEGDKIQALLLACGFNMRKCLRAVSYVLFLDWIFFKSNQNYEVC